MKHSTLGSHNYLTSKKQLIRSKKEKISNDRKREKNSNGTKYFNKTYV